MRRETKLTGRQGVREGVFCRNPDTHKVIRFCTYQYGVCIAIYFHKQFWYPGDAALIMMIKQVFTKGNKLTGWMGKTRFLSMCCSPDHASSNQKCVMSLKPKSQGAM